MKMDEGNKLIGTPHICLVEAIVLGRFSLKSKPVNDG
jgi:hypothetical protein